MSPTSSVKRIQTIGNSLEEIVETTVTRMGARFVASDSRRSRIDDIVSRYRRRRMHALVRLLVASATILTLLAL